MLRFLFFFVSLLPTTLALDNGLARTPPMGWLSWERFRCNVDCENDPDNCISENLFKEMADRIEQDGYKDVGYSYVIIDDCWPEKERDPDGNLQPDKKRFPNGIKTLADYIHSKGLKFGIYEDYGTHTCAGYPGIVGHMQNDSQSFAKWDVDYVKLDGCYSDPSTMDKGYPMFGKFLNKTGRPMVYSCSWPVYQSAANMTPNFTSIAEHCNLWRNYDDIQDSWASVLDIIEYFAQNEYDIQKYAGPGQWNDPDMLIIGNYGLSYDQSKTQMAIWAILAAPLIMSADLRNIRDEYKAILQNKNLIAVNQDPLGIQGKRIYNRNRIEIWTRPITPLAKGYYSYAVVFLSRRDDGMPYSVSINLEAIGLNYPLGYNITDLYSDQEYGIVLPTDNIAVRVNPSGVVALRADVQSKVPSFINVLSQA